LSSAAIASRASFGSEIFSTVVVDQPRRMKTQDRVMQTRLCGDRAQDKRASRITGTVDDDAFSGMPQHGKKLEITTDFPSSSGFDPYFAQSRIEADKEKQGSTEGTSPPTLVPLRTASQDGCGSPISTYGLVRLVQLFASVQTNAESAPLVFGGGRALCVGEGPWVLDTDRQMLGRLRRRCHQRYSVRRIEAVPHVLRDDHHHACVQRI
jgi:hypothetical protein